MTKIFLWEVCIMGVFRKGNRWYIDYYFLGRRKREVVTITGKNPSDVTLRDAEKALAIRKAEIAQGKFDIKMTEKPIKIETLIRSYLEWADENHKSPARDHTACKNLVRLLRGKDIQSLSLWHIEKYKSNRKKQGRKPETINKELGVLRRMFNLAYKGVLNIKINNNPLKGLTLLTVPKIRRRVLKDSEFQALYKSSSEHLKPILLCAYMTGMRRSEIAKLRWKNVDLEDGFIHVVESKNNESRTIPIAKALLETLLILKDQSRGDYVFTHCGDKHYTSATSWRRAWNSAMKKSDIDRCRFHDLRHTFISNLIVNEKEDFATVMELSGHKDISMLKHYSHTREEAKRNAINKLNIRYSNGVLNRHKLKTK